MDRQTHYTPSLLDERSRRGGPVIESEAARRYLEEPFNDPRVCSCSSSVSRQRKLGACRGRSALKLAGAANRSSLAERSAPAGVGIGAPNCTAPPARGRCCTSTRTNKRLRKCALPHRGNSPNPYLKEKWFASPQVTMHLRVHPSGQVNIYAIRKMPDERLIGRLKGAGWSVTEIKGLRPQLDSWANPLTVKWAFPQIHTCLCRFGGDC